MTARARRRRRERPALKQSEVDDLFTKAAQSIDLPAFPLVDPSQLDVARPEVGGVFQAPYFYYRLDILWRKQ